tara:strand:+ start:731 stop:1318 length:588 start_codon:yes stop_codon:yes gene_type:complete
MRNRFNVDESEKNHIRGLYKINEQIGSKYMGGYSELGLPIAYENCVSAEDITDEQINGLWEFYGSQDIEDNSEVSIYKSFFQAGRDVTAEDITDEQIEEFYSYVDGLLLKYKFETELQVPECRRNSTINEDTGMDTPESQHETFMSNLHSMCGQIEGMGGKMKGNRKCDGGTTDGSGGCYEPLIKLVKEYCSTRA